MNGVRLMDWTARVLFGLALLVLTGTAVAWVAQQPAFDIRHIEVRGSGGHELQHVTSGSVRAAVAGQLAGGFFSIRLDEARRSFEEVPWVAAASVRRVWPDRLLVTLREHRALGVWSDGRLLSDTGVLFVANPAEAEIYGPLVEFSGPSQFAPEAARRFYEIASMLAPLDLAVTSLSVSDRAAWSVATADGPRFELGRDEPPGRLYAQLNLIASNYPLVVARLGSAPQRVDARYANGFAAAAAVTKKR